jgi:hypothetical protein
MSYPANQSLKRSIRPRPCAVGLCSVLLGFIMVAVREGREKLKGSRAQGTMAPCRYQMRTLQAPPNTPVNDRLFRAWPPFLGTLGSSRRREGPLYVECEIRWVGTGRALKLSVGRWGCAAELRRCRLSAGHFEPFSDQTVTTAQNSNGQGCPSNSKYARPDIPSHRTAHGQSEMAEGDPVKLGS